MGLRINQNITALNAHRNLVATDSALSKSLERLSSGLRINRAADDAAGLAISEKMRGQIKGLAQAIRNAQDGISLIQTAEGALNEVHSILQRMRQLAVQAANDTNTEDDRIELQKEVEQLKADIDRIANQTQFNTMDLLKGQFAVKLNEDTTVSTLLADGSFVKLSFSGLVADTWTLAYDDTSKTYTLTGDTTGIVLISTPDTALDSAGGILRFGGPNGESVTIEVNNSYTAGALDGLVFEVTGASGLKFHIGANKGQNFTVTIDDMRITGGTNPSMTALANVDITTQDGANDAIQVIDEAIKQVSSTRATLGAYQNRLEHTIANLGVAKENLAAAESRIRDVDMAEEMMEFTRSQILLQAGVAMLAQANTIPQAVLQLLR
jgi:flagellin